jgi:hypothetical protein
MLGFKSLRWMTVAVLCLPFFSTRGEDWLGQTGAKIQLMPKSEELTLYSKTIPYLVQDDDTRTATIYGINWPITASKENGQCRINRSRVG